MGYFPSGLRLSERADASQREDIKHEGVTLLLEFRGVDQQVSGTRARPRHDRDVLLAVDLKRHGRRRETRTDIDLPQLVERGVIMSRDGTVH